MPRYAPNKVPGSVKKRYFELIRQGYRGAVAARAVGVSVSCGSVWFLDAGGVLIPDPGPVSPRLLDQDDRIAIADGLAARLDKKVIAARIGKSFQTVYREVRRNSKPDGAYQPFWAHNQALLRRKRPKRPKVAAEPRLGSVVRRKLERKWSPQQVTRFLRRTYPGQASMHACAETIYRALFAGLLGHKPGKLRTGRSRRKRHRRSADVPNKIKNMKLLDQRPAEVLERRVPGHWEGDLIIGRHMNSAIATLVETHHQVRRPDPPTEWLQSSTAARRDDHPNKRNPRSLTETLTWDQGREMVLHEQISVATGFDIYFCDPHSPWQRGLNENTNGLLRQYFPKSTDLSVHSASDLRRVASELNRRPRIGLDDRAPADLMQELRNDNNTPFATTG